MLDDRERAALETGRVGRLATADADGRPHVVPVCYSLVAVADGPARLVTPVDEKPKSAGPADLRRVRNVGANPMAAVVVDRYVEDWDRLWWVQVRGPAVVLAPGDGGHGAAVASLRDRYDQYADHALAERPVIAVEAETVRSWGDLP